MPLGPMPVEPKKRVTVWTWLIFFGLFAPADALKCLLLLGDLIPVLGWIVDGVVSLIVSIPEATGYVGLWGTGLYRGSKHGGLVNVVISWATIGLDFTPVLDAFPFTAPSVLFVILKAKAIDKLEYVEYKVKLAAWQKQHQDEEAIRLQIAQNAAANANAQREQAMAMSLAANA